VQIFIRHSICVRRHAGVTWNTAGRNFADIATVGCESCLVQCGCVRRSMRRCSKSLK